MYPADDQMHAAAQVLSADLDAEDTTLNFLRPSP